MTQLSNKANAVRTLSNTAATHPVARLHQWFSDLLAPVQSAPCAPAMLQSLLAASADAVVIGHSITRTDGAIAATVNVELGSMWWELNSLQAATLRLQLVGHGANRPAVVAIANRIAAEVCAAEVSLCRAHAQQRLMAAPAGYTGKGGLH